VIEGVMSAMFRAGLGVANYNIQFDEAMEVRFLSSLEDNGAAGLVIWLGNETDAVRDCLIRLKERQFPVVLADRCFPDVDLDFVASNNDEIGYRLTRALIERGHER